MDYLGGRCDGKSDIESDNWIKIAKGTKLSFSLELNNNYSFIPGPHRYNIGTLAFDFVNEDWLADKIIYKDLFSILTWTLNKDEDNEMNNNLLPEHLTHIESYKNKNNIKEFMENFGYYGEGDNSFIIRSNQVIISLDGKDISPPLL